jgi:hypothetical protein
VKARVTIEYDIPKWDEAALGLQALREREEQRWITSEVVLGLPSAIGVAIPSAWAISSMSHP